MASEPSAAAAPAAGAAAAAAGTAETPLPKGWTVIKEGMARVIYDETDKVFYNKVQVMNRDTSIQCIRAYVKRYCQKVRRVRTRTRKPQATNDGAGRS
jgi:tRNA G26 N,N-dimethylase Trm1